MANSHAGVLLQKIFRNIILLIGLISALGSVGININAVIASLGLTGFALGFALKDILSNTIAGFMLILSGMLKPKQRIAVDNIEGIVRTINLRNTEIDAGEKIYLVPNKTVLSKTVTIFKRVT